MLDIKVNAQTALILGSGWNKVIDKVRVIKSIGLILHQLVEKI